MSRHALPGSDLGAPLSGMDNGRARLHPVFTP
jgi:hypothetical protein